VENVVVNYFILLPLLGEGGHLVSW